MNRRACPRWQGFDVIELREEAARVGIELSAYTVAADFLRGSGGDTAKEVERIKTAADLAAILGVPAMCHDASYGFPDDYQGIRSFDSVLPRLRDACRELTEYAAERGLKQSGYEGGLAIEFEGREDPLTGIALGQANLRKLVELA